MSGFTDVTGLNGTGGPDGYDDATKLNKTDFNAMQGELSSLSREQAATASSEKALDAQQRLNDLAMKYNVSMAYLQMALSLIGKISGR